MSGGGSTLDALLATWAAKSEVATVLERAVGADAKPACRAITRGVVHVTCIVDDAATADTMRAAYGPSADVRLASDERPMPKCDLVVVHGAAPGAGGDWRGPLAALVKNAQKLAVVVAPNPRSAVSRVRSVIGRGADGWGATEGLAPVLWDLGRVRDHVWLETSRLGERLAQRAPGFTRALSRSHAFVVDVAPRSRQARRKLRLNQEQAG
jgi:hypothetical protein